MAFKVAIIGAGLAGCMLARLLTHRSDNINVTIFESESSIDFRSQGGTLDLHVRTGQRALKEADLYHEFLKYARFDFEAMAFADKNLVCYLTASGNMQGSTTERPEIDRPQLRKLLYESLPDGIVKWNHKLTHVCPDLNLHFVDQPPQGQFDLVVGADGGWSRVRPLLTATKPLYCGIRLTVRLGRCKKHLGAIHGRRQPQHRHCAVRAEELQEACGYDVHDAKATKEAGLRDNSDWDSRLVDYTQRSEDHVVPRHLYMLPIGHTWEQKRGVTLIGDAAHLMTLFAGEGVNLALEDCILLAEAIVNSASSAELDRRVGDFERDMFMRAQKTAQLTYDMMHAMFMIPDAPRSSIERYLLRAVEADLGRLMTFLITPLVFAYFFVFKLVW